MHRALWLALCLAFFGALVSIKAIATPSLFAGVAGRPDAPQMGRAPDDRPMPNRAAKADRLPLPDMRAPPRAVEETAPPPVAPVESAPLSTAVPAEPDRKSADDAPPMAVTRQHGRKTSTRLTAAPPPQRIARPRRTAEANRTGKVILRTLPCRQDAGAYGMLRALDLTPRCGA